MSDIWSERLYRALLTALPRAFRTEYGDAMVRAFGEWRAAAVRRGGGATRRVWVRAVADLVRSGVREWASVLRGVASTDGPPYGAAALMGLAVLLLYAVTLAPTTGFWDAGEYITVAHILGIPHPPGNPLFVLLAGAWERLLSPLGLSTAVSINLLSAVLSAAAHGVWFLVVDRALAGWGVDRVARRIGAVAAALLSATAFTVWNQSNVNEKVYTVSLFTTALIMWLALRWRDRGRGVVPLALIAFLIALTSTNHLMGVLVGPAALVFVLLVDPRPLLRGRFWALALPLVILALAVPLFLPVRAAQAPIVAEGDPRCPSMTEAATAVYTWGRSGCDALGAVLRREQYAKPPIRSDPTDPSLPRGPALIAAQALNWLQYADWQWARSVSGRQPLFGGVRPLVSLGFLLLIVLGARTHWRSDWRSAACVGVLVVTLTAGLVYYLNFKYGYAIANDRYPAPWMHEVRERDYFFLVGFSVLGLWAGIGVTTLWRGIAVRLAGRAKRPRLAAAPILSVALLPLALNWAWASRADDYMARDFAYNVLMSVAPYGVLVTNGDNDSFPLWYLQEVEGLRQDVTVVLAPLLGTPWYVRQIRDLTEPCPPGVAAADAPGRIVCQRPLDPRELPAALVQFGWTEAVRSPNDSIVPLGDEEIARVASEWFVTDRPMPLQLGRIETQIPGGTTIGPADVYAAAILRATLGERPVHFMPGSPIARNLGLSAHVVRQGLVWRLENAPTLAGVEDIVPLPTATRSIEAAAVDLPITDTLLWDVYVKRGRVLDPSLPWADHATVTIPLQYTFAHLDAGQAHAATGSDQQAGRHVAHADWWQAVALNTPRPDL